MGVTKPYEELKDEFIEELSAYIGTKALPHDKVDGVFDAIASHPELKNYLQLPRQNLEYHNKFYGYDLSTAERPLGDIRKMWRLTHKGFAKTSELKKVDLGNGMHVVVLVATQDATDVAADGTDIDRTGCMDVLFVLTRR